MPNQTHLFPDVPSVSELTGQIKELIESAFPDVLVEGEISNVKESRNGHLYFTVKDDQAQLPCVIWRGVAQRLQVNLVDGQQVILGGSLQVYAPHGRYQMIVSFVEQAGIGALQRAFEKLKEKLQKEGIFDDIHKKPLQEFPVRIGVVTSATGAAFQDISSTLEKRWPVANIYLYPASVQGVNAAPELVNAIEWFSEDGSIDLLIVGRGGGSLEDLWAFNEEAVARAIFECKIPVISAVGHEVDFSISDFVADARAATPTQAAIIATPDINEVRFYVEDLSTAMENRIRQKTDAYREKVLRLSQSHALHAVYEQIQSFKNRTDSLTQTLRYKMDKILSGYRERVSSSHYRLELMNPTAPLERGFVRILQDKSWIRKKDAFQVRKNFDVEWKDGVIKIEN
jgi:exodeoxyribonuclease VII large subunit